MRTELNRLATLAAMLRNGGDVIDVADELDAMAAETTGATLGAREGPSEEWKAIEWCGNNAAEFSRYNGKCYVMWVDDNFDERRTEDANWREVITKAMAEDAVSGQASEVAT